MKRSKKIYALLGVLAVLLVATVLVLQYEEKREEIENSGEVIVAVTEDEIKELSWEYENNALAFHKDEKWIYDGDEAFPVDEEKLMDLISCFEQWEASFVIEKVEDYGQYGLDNPDCTIHLATEEKDLEISLGDFSAMDEERYVSIGDGNVYLVSQDPAEDFYIPLGDLIKQDEVPDIEEATGLTFAGTKADASRYGKVTLEDESITYSEDDLYYMDVNGEKMALDSELVENYLYSLEGLNLGEFVTYHGTEEELLEYGLMEPELIVTVSYPKEEDDGETVTEEFTVSVGRKEADAKKAQEREKEDETKEEGENDSIPAYVRIGESPIIYEISESEYDSFMAASYEDLRHQEVFWADFDLVKEMEISLDGENYVITAEGKKDDPIWKLADEEIEAGSIKSTLETITAEEFTKEGKTGKEEISLVLHLDQEKIKEVSIAFYRQDGSSCLAYVDGEPVAYVDRAEVIDLVEAVNEVVLK